VSLGLWGQLIYKIPISILYYVVNLVLSPFFKLYSCSLAMPTHLPLFTVAEEGGRVLIAISYWPTVKIKNGGSSTVIEI